MATLVCFWKVKRSQKVAKTTVFTEGKFNRKCQSHVWFWFCPRGMFTQRLRKPLFFTEGLWTAGVQHNVCLCFHRCGMFGTCCLSGKFNRKVPEVQGEEPSVGPPPYNERTVMEGEGVYCYKCNVYRTNSWYKLYTHLRLRCLDIQEKPLLINSYLHVQAKKELRVKAQAKRRSREPLVSPPVVSESETQLSPPTGPVTLPHEVPRVPTFTPDVLPAGLQQQSDSAPSTPGALPGASAHAESRWSTPGALPRVPVTEEPSARDAIVVPPPATSGPVAVTAPPPSDVIVAHDGTCWIQTQACYM